MTGPVQAKRKAALALRKLAMPVVTPGPGASPFRRVPPWSRARRPSAWPGKLRLCEQRERTGRIRSGGAA